MAKICMVVSEGTFDKAYMPLIMANTAAASGDEVHIFYSFFGTKLVTKKANPKLPGMFRLFTGMFQKKMKAVGIGNYMETFKQAQELGVNFYACSTTMDLMGVKKEDLLPNVKVLGAAAFLKLAVESEATLFIG
ncbi:MAG: DsrE/DsrF/DrsH-like family protein [Thermoplasmata archaeon]|jgi:peroxiredoxin family protein|nr:DsrE/DsrF/DrsH-like family protein [Thermoplasmata archaeon]